jgi:hypothetical protein
MNEKLKYLLRLFLDYVPIVWALFLLAMVLCGAISCTTTKYVPVENTAVDSVYINVLQRDSIFVQDSIYIREKADTVFVTRWHVEYRDALRIDTFYIERVDSVNHIVEIEKRLTKVQQLKMDIGNGVMYAVPIILALYVLYRKMKK